MIIPIGNKQHKSQNKIQYKRDTKNLPKEEFILDYLNIDWEAMLEIGKNYVYRSTEKVLSNMNATIDKHMPLRKLTTKECKQKIEPWLTPKIISKIDTKNKRHIHEVKKQR